MSGSVKTSLRALVVGLVVVLGGSASAEFGTRGEPLRVETYKMTGRSGVPGEIRLPFETKLLREAEFHLGLIKSIETSGRLLDPEMRKQLDILKDQRAEVESKAEAAARLLNATMPKGVYAGPSGLAEFVIVPPAAAERLGLMTRDAAKQYDAMLARAVSIPEGVRGKLADLKAKAQELYRNYAKDEPTLRLIDRTVEAAEAVVLSNAYKGGDADWKSLSRDLDGMRKTLTAFIKVQSDVVFAAKDVTATSLTHTPGSGAPTNPTRTRAEVYNDLPQFREYLNRAMDEMRTATGPEVAKRLEMLSVMEALMTTHGDYGLVVSGFAKLNQFRVDAIRDAKGDKALAREMFADRIGEAMFGKKVWEKFSREEKDRQVCVLFGKCPAMRSSAVAAGCK